MLTPENQGLEQLQGQLDEFTGDWKDEYETRDGSEKIDFTPQDKLAKFLEDNWDGDKYQLEITLSDGAWDDPMTLRGLSYYPEYKMRVEGKKRVLIVDAIKTTKVTKVDEDDVVVHFVKDIDRKKAHLRVLLSGEKNLVNLLPYDIEDMKFAKKQEAVGKKRGKIVDIELVEHQEDLDRFFWGWKKDPRINKDDRELRDGGQGELDHYLRTWKEDYFKMLGITLTLSGDTIVPAGLEGVVRRVGDVIEIDLSDLNAPHLLKGQRDGYLASFNNEGEVEISKCVNGRIDWDSIWVVGVDNVLNMKWKRVVSEGDLLMDEDGKMVIRNDDDLAKLMKMADERDADVQMRWEEDPEDVAWTVKRVQFWQYSAVIYAHCDRYSNPEQRFELSEILKDGATFELAKEDV